MKRFLLVLLTPFVLMFSSANAAEELQYIIQAGADETYSGSYAGHKQ